MFWPLKVLRGAIAAVNELLRYQGHPAVLVHPAIMHVLLDTYTAGTANTVNLCITILVQVLTQAGRQIISWPARLCYYRRLTNNCTGLRTRYSKTISVFLAFIFLYYDCTMGLLPKLCLCVINVSMKLAYTMNVI